MLHIAGEQNAMTDIPSRSFGSEAKWHCTTDKQFLTLNNLLLPLPKQAPWNYFHLSFAASKKVISILQTKHFKMDKWWHLQNAWRHIGPIGKSFSNLWEWTLTYRECHTPSAADRSLGLPHLSAQVMLGEAAKLQLKQSLLDVSRFVVKILSRIG